MKKIFFTLGLLVAIFMIALPTIMTVYAQGADDVITSDDKARKLGTSTAQISLSECVKDGSCGVGHVEILLSNLIRWGAGVSGAVALFMYAIGAIWMIFSAGNQSRIERGKDIIRGTTLALVFVLGSWVIVQFVLSALGSNVNLKTTEDSGTGNYDAPKVIGCCVETEQRYPDYVGCIPDTTKTACEESGISRPDSIFQFAPDTACTAFCPE